jgi:hypothetical protein
MTSIANSPTPDAMALELAADRIVSLEHDVIVYCEIVQLAIHKLHDVTKQNDRLREQLREVRGRYREAA